jgi:CrcB protein
MLWQEGQGFEGLNVSMQSVLIVFAGGGLGAVARHLMNMSVTRLIGSEFPWGVMLINISGSVIMGMAAAFFAFKADASWSQPLRLFMTTGILGGYTTFSAFSLDVVLLWERGEPVQALTYVMGSVILSVLGLVAGLTLVRLWA